MSSLKAAMKGHQKTHRERGQVEGRKHLGLLEKHKDYVIRAKDFHRKEKTIKTLKKKAFEKNPDEFYFQMIRSKTKEGVHIKERDHKIYTNDQIKLLKTQDLNYINLKRGVELKKIEKMKKSLHMFEAADNQSRTHTFFFDSKEEVKAFNPVEQFDTLPELLSRSHNIPTVNMLKTHKFESENRLKKRTSKKTLREKSYEELGVRINREEQLKQARQELVLKRQLMGKGRVYKRKNKNGTTTYRWKKSRKR